MIKQGKTSNTEEYKRYKGIQRNENRNRPVGPFEAEGVLWFRAPLRQPQLRTVVLPWAGSATVPTLKIEVVCEVRTVGL